MPVRFNPTGSLDIATDPADLPSQSDGKMEVSGSMSRCTNLDLDRAGIARTRRGSAKLNETAINPDINRIIEQAGIRYAFAEANIYRNETLIGSGSAGKWSATLYNSYATTVQSVFALNGTDRKRIEGGNIYEWGSESPLVAPVLMPGGGTGLTGAYNAKYTWCRKEGDTVVWESNPSPAADTAITLSNGSLVIVATLPTDTQITHIRFYRTLTAGAVYYWDQDIAVTYDTIDYDYSYMYDWEQYYAQNDLTYEWGYTYDWEAAYVTGSKSKIFIDDPLNNGVVTYTWEIPTIYYPNGPHYDYIRLYPGTDESWKYSFPWELEIVEEPLLSGTAYQAFIEDPDNNGIVFYTWELDPAYAGTDSGLKAFTRWEYELYGLSIDSDTADDSLGSEASWIDHDRPPLGTLVTGPNYAGICFIIKDNLLYYCLPNQPEYWPDSYYIEVTPVQYPLKGMAFINGQLFVASAIEVYAIQGSGPGTFFPLPVSAQTGVVNEDCILGVAGYGLFHLGNDGIYQYAGGKDNLISRGGFEPLFRGETRGNIPGMNRNMIDKCWMQAYHGKLYLGYPGGTSEYPDNLLVMDLATNRMVHHDYPAYFRTIAIDHYNGRMLAGDTEGYIWQFENVTLTDDDGTAIDWQIQSKDFSQYYKYFPRYIKYDVNVNGGTANGYVIVNETIKQTHSITGNRLTKKRLIAGCTGDRMSLRLAGSGGVLIYGAEAE